MSCSKRDADCNSRGARIPAVEQVIPVIVVVDVNIVGLVPVVSPVLRIRIDRGEPIATVLEARITAYHHEWEIVNAERVIPAIVAAVVGLRNAIAVVAAALLPGAML